MYTSSYPSAAYPFSDLALSVSQKLRCTDATSDNLFCQKCAACRLKYILQHFRPWFNNAGDSSRHAFIHGILMRLHNASILRDLNDILQSACGKDSAYAISRTHPSAPGDRNRMTADKNLQTYEWTHMMDKVFTWFDTSDAWMQRNFLLVMLSQCDYHLLRVVNNFVQRHLNVEMRTKSAKSRRSTSAAPVRTVPEVNNSKTNNEEEDKAANLDYAYVEQMNFEYDPDAGDVMQCRKQVSTLMREANPPPPLTEPGETSPLAGMTSEEEGDDLLDFSSSEGDDEDHGQRMLDVRVDCVSSLSASAYTLAGRKVDFIRQLPIHISKYILNLLDERTLKRCTIVSRVWAQLAGEVIKEALVNQLVKEGAMVTQGSSTNAVNPLYAKDAEIPVPNLMKSGSHRILYLIDLSAMNQRKPSVLPQVDEKLDVDKETPEAASDSKTKSTPDIVVDGVPNNSTNPPAPAESLLSAGVRSRKLSTASATKPPTPLSIAPSRGSKRSRRVSTQESPGDPSSAQPDTNTLNILEEGNEDDNSAAESSPAAANANGADEAANNKTTDKSGESNEGGNSVRSGGADMLYKADCSMEAAYATVSTRKVIMEERNVYCGAYSVLVLIDGPPTNRPDPTRVLHYSGGDLVAFGNGERALRLMDVENRETAPRLKIRGHAGSIKAVYVNEKEGYLLSGSYDTSLRQWDASTGQCLRIYRGHMGSITSLAVFREYFVSGSMDSSARLWKVGEKHSIFSLKHRAPVTAVDIGEVLIISGDQTGRVKVWELFTGKLIKSLLGHTEEVTSIKSDRYHIFTASRDCYVLMWSTVGYFNTCLRAFRHPRAVLNISYQYLRIISGCEDGRIRVWNVLNGKCCRIMRGNSRSDPILHLIPVANRMIINTATNVIVFNFEPVEYRYDLEDDSIPNLLPYKSYLDAPIRKLHHSLVRAQRSLHLTQTSYSQQIRAPPVDVREETLRFDLSPEFLRRRIQRPFSTSTAVRKSRLTSASTRCNSAKTDFSRRPKSGVSADAMHHAHSDVAPAGQAGFSEVESRVTSATRSRSSKSVVTTSAKGGQRSHDTRPTDATTVTSSASGMRSIRRASYGFEGILETGSPEDLISLQDMKAFLKTQLRMPPEEATAVQPPFIKMTADAIRQIAATTPTKISSGGGNLLKPPSRPKAASVISANQVEFAQPTLPPPVLPPPSTGVQVDNAIRPSSNVKHPVFEEIRCQFESVPIHMKRTHPSHFPRKVTTSVPKPLVIRPKTATFSSTAPPQMMTSNPEEFGEEAPRAKRPISAATTTAVSKLSLRQRRPMSSVSRMSCFTKDDEEEEQGSAAVCVPIKLYPADMMEKVRQRKQQLDIRLKRLASQPSDFQAPRTLLLRTHDQEAQYLADIEAAYEARAKAEDEKREKMKMRMWKTKVAKMSMSS